jgi:FimV-like protein
MLFERTRPIPLFSSQSSIGKRPPSVRRTHAETKIPIVPATDERAIAVATSGCNDGTGRGRIPLGANCPVAAGNVTRVRFRGKRLPPFCGLLRAGAQRLPRIGDALHDLGRVDRVTFDLTMLRPSVLKILIPGLLLPGAAMALGLGDIHVESALNQPLAAQIEIVVGPAENSAGLSATIPDMETFQRHGLERPASLASTALTVRRDEQGRTVLFLRSTDAFTEPMVTLLVDLHSTNGELIREYTVMLDPPGGALEQAAVSSATVRESSALVSVPGAASASELSPDLASPSSGSPSSSASVAPAEQTAAPAAKRATDTYTVARHDTLDRIAGIAGARTRSDRHKMMIAIFRANPSAFRTNFNSLRSGVTLHLPSVADLSKIRPGEANQEFATQMAAWRSTDHRASSVASSSVATPIASPATAASAATSSANSIVEEKADIEAHKAETVALTQRIVSLEKSLDEVREKLRQPPVVQQSPMAQRSVEHPAVVPRSVPADAAVAAATAGTGIAAAGTTAVATAGTSASGTAAAAVASAPTEQYTDNSATEEEDNPPPRRRNWLVTLALRVGAVFAVGIALALAVIAGVRLYRRRRSDDDSFAERDFAQEESARRESDSQRLAQTDDTSLPFAKVDISTSYLVEELKHEAEHALASLDGDADAAFGAGAGPGEVASAGAAGAAAGVDAPTAAGSVARAGTFAGAGNSAAPNTLDATVELDATEALQTLEQSDATSLHPVSASGTRKSDAQATDPTVRLAIDPTVRLPTPHNSSETTALLTLHPDLTLDDTAAREFAFFNPESTLNTTHVMIGGDSGDPKPFVERRKNPADVLRQAIEREPERSDLRLKLLELYYTAAAQNRRAFLEGVRQLAKNEKLVASASDWAQIEDMARAIAPDDELFSNSPGADKKAVA